MQTITMFVDSSSYRFLNVALADPWCVKSAVIT